MIEVFKTSVRDQGIAHRLVDKIHTCFIDQVANFDLDDCDKILRVKCTTGCIECSGLIDLLRRFGYEAEVLPDEDQPVNRIQENAPLHN